MKQYEGNRLRRWWGSLGEAERSALREKIAGTVAQAAADDSLTRVTLTFKFDDGQVRTVWADAPSQTAKRVAETIIGKMLGGDSDWLRGVTGSIERRVTAWGGKIGDGKITGVKGLPGAKPSGHVVINVPRAREQINIKAPDIYLEVKPVIQTPEVNMAVQPADVVVVQTHPKGAKEKQVIKRSKKGDMTEVEGEIEYEYE